MEPMQRLHPLFLMGPSSKHRDGWQKKPTDIHRVWRFAHLMIKSFVGGMLWRPTFAWGTDILNSLYPFREDSESKIRKRKREKSWVMRW